MVVQRPRRKNVRAACTACVPLSNQRYSAQIRGKTGPGLFSFHHVSNAIQERNHSRVSASSACAQEAASHSLMRRYALNASQTAAGAIPFKKRLLGLLPALAGSLGKRWPVSGTASATG